MRIWLKPDKLAEFGLTPSGVAGVLREQNTQAAAGSMGGQPATEDVAFTYGVTTLGRLSDPEQLREIIVRANPDGSALRLKDVARIELGAQRYEFTATYNRRPTVSVATSLPPKSAAGSG